MNEQKATESNDDRPILPRRTWAQFLEATAPNEWITIAGVVQRVASGGGSSHRLYSPPSAHDVVQPADIQLHCRHQLCGTNRAFSFACTTGDIYLDEGDTFKFITYRCRNCNETLKTFAVILRYQSGRLNGHDLGSSDLDAMKFGELPRFGPPLSTRTLRLMHEDAELFKKGFRAETEGYGVGAFAYYRRVVEKQRQHLFEELQKAAHHLGDDDAVELLQRAAAENQFEKAVDLVKDGLPRRLYIEGHNPLTLLHDALSNDLHAASDAECLELATSIRTVLTEMGDRMAEITADKAGIKKAVSTILKKPRR